VLTVDEVPAPTPEDDEVLVRVSATTVSRTDCGILLGKPFPIRFFTGLRRPRSRVPGTDFAGEVVQTGPAVTDFAVGDRVWGFDDSGLASQAQFLAIGQDAAVAGIPDGVDAAQATASAEGAHYALNFMKRARYVSGQRVCVYGATGAIGSAAVQLLVAEGSEVTAFCRAEHAELVRGLGADTVVDYTTQDLATYPDRFDLVFDAVGKSTFAAARPLLGDAGRYVSSELGPHGQNLYLPLTTRLRPGARVDFPFPTGGRVTIRHMTRLLAEGRFRPMIDRHFPLEDVRSAYEHVLTGQKLGNVILDIP
jgi:NADPH:quinone reductase-like Zn-dependent oxidoreductase